jgi:AcrR family transcriptional regulator
MTRKYETTEIRHRQIVDAARKVIIKYGSEHLTVKKIAHEVGISETDIYRHYKSKRDILSFLIGNIGDTLVHDITATSNENHTPLQVLDNVLKNHLSTIEQRRGISFQVIAEIISLGDKKLNKKVSEVIDRYVNRLKEILAKGIESGEIREDIDLEAAAIALFGMIQGIVNIWALKSYSFDPQKKYAASWNIFREALIKRA